jgi:hypothetical protein
MTRCARSSRAERKGTPARTGAKDTGQEVVPEDPRSRVAARGSVADEAPGCAGALAFQARSGAGGEVLGANR